MMRIQLEISPFNYQVLQDVFCIDFRIVDEHLCKEFRRHSQSCVWAVEQYELILSQLNPLRPPG